MNHKVKVGDKIRLLTSGGYGECKPGDVLTVVEVYGNDSGVRARKGPAHLTFCFSYFEYEVLTETPKFKVGDKVRVRSHLAHDGGDYSWISGYGLNVGSETEVTRVDGRFVVRGLYKGDADWPVTCHPSLFEQVPAKETELERLVRVANEGLVAILQLKQGFSDKVAAYGGGDISQYFTSRIDIKPTPTFEPFYVGHADPYKGWLVKLEGDTLHVGCHTLKAKDAKWVLEGFCRRKDLVKSDSAGINLWSNRDGIRSGKGDISWSDADRLLAALEKAGV